MKTKILLTLLFLGTLTGYVFAQTPGSNYQTVLRDKEGIPMPNTRVTLYISLADGPAGHVLYKESQMLTTNDLESIKTYPGSVQASIILSLRNYHRKHQGTPSFC